MGGVPARCFRRPGQRTVAAGDAAPQHGVIGGVEAHFVEAPAGRIETHEFGREAIGKPAILQGLR